MDENIIEDAVEIGGGGGGIEAPAEAPTDADMEIQQILQGAAQYMRDITNMATDVLLAYIRSGGNYVSLDTGHVRQAIRISKIFNAEVQAEWADVRNKAISDANGTSKSNIITLNSGQ